VVGSYFWYRALVDAVPYADKRLCLLFMLFAPSIVFWPAALGKEALMQLGVGAMAWATSLALQGRLGRAVPLALGGGWLLYVVRPHLLALVTVAAAVPYFIGRTRRAEPGTFSGRPVGMVVIGLLVVFTMTAGTKFVGLESLSLDSVEEQLDAQTAATSYGGSTYNTGNLSITNPLFLPVGFVTVLFRPFIFEARGLLPMLAAVESAVLLWLTFHRFDSIRLALRRCRQEPFVLYCIMLLVFYSATFSSLANFGLLTRQRSLVLPALYALLALDPVRARRWIQRQEQPDQWGPSALVASVARNGSVSPNGADGTHAERGVGANGHRANGSNGHGANGRNGSNGRSNGNGSQRVRGVGVRANGGNGSNGGGRSNGGDGSNGGHGSANGGHGSNGGTGSNGGNGNGGPDSNGDAPGNGAGSREDRRTDDPTAPWRPRGDDL
jgi:hypothetical protein